jgi:6-phosphogluconolactonase
VTSPRPDIRVCEDPAALARRGAEGFAELARRAVAARGRFAVALAGGSTPRGAYARLAAPPFSEAIAWDKLHCFWGDERCVPPGHPDSNYGMASAALLSKVPLPPGNIHRLRGEQADPERAAADYARDLADFFGLAEGGLPRFDLILLGLGEDGHTASLFPGTAALGETRRWVVANDVPHLSAARLTLTFPVLNNAAHVLFLVSGVAKAAAFREIALGRPGAERLPAHRVRPADGSLAWLVDRAAAGDLPL